MDGWAFWEPFSLGHWLRCVTLSEPDREEVGQLLQSTDQLSDTTSEWVKRLGMIDAICSFVLFSFWYD